MEGLLSTGPTPSSFKTRRHLRDVLCPGSRRGGAVLEVAAGNSLPSPHPHTKDCTLYLTVWQQDIVRELFVVFVKSNGNVFMTFGSGQTQNLLIFPRLKTIYKKL